MSCLWREKALLYADDELGSAAQQEVASHLQGCAECSAAVAGELQLKKAIRLAGRRFTAPPDLRRSIRQTIQMGAGRRPYWRWEFAAVALLVAIALGLFFLQPHPPDTIMAELVDQHVTTLASQNPVDVVSTDRHTVKPWFQGKLPFTFNLPEIAKSPFTLIGGKSVFVQQNPGAELLYEIRKHKISVFIFQARDSKAAGANNQLSFPVVEWVQGGLRFYLVTDAAKEDAVRLMSLFREANQS